LIIIIIFLKQATQNFISLPKEHTRLRGPKGKHM